MRKLGSESLSDQWRRTVMECNSRDPSITKRQWCEENNVKFRSLMYWQRRFQDELPELPEDGDAALADTDGLSDTDILSDINAPADEAALPIDEQQAPAPAFADVTEKLEEMQAEQAEQDPSWHVLPTIFMEPEVMIQAGAYQVYVSRHTSEAALAAVLKVIRYA